VGAPLHLQSELLAVDVLPDNGGRIASIRCRRTGAEFLLAGSDYNATAHFSAAASFVESDCAGVDECLPTVALSDGANSALPGLPDHGDLWRHAWRVVDQSETSVLLSTECFSLPLSFSRGLRVQASEINLDYCITNLSDAPVQFLYACHPLFAIDDGDRVILPPEIKKMCLHYSRGQRAGHLGEWITWPQIKHNGDQLALDRAGKISDETAELLYSGRLTRGTAALYRARLQQAIVMRFDTRLLPYFGLWLCNGGWPDEPTSKPKQYAIAIEPTVAPYGSLAAAAATGTAPVLDPGKVFAFSLRFEVRGCDKPCSYDEVVSYVSAPAI
jgi:galactose mutarotase-like enzyme